jgi:16S rRNA (adenine1518-N6/adenine1519-N6)-dimethyltransferase
MHTKQDIQRLLSAAGISPNRRLGQNFLIDLNLMRLFVEAAQLDTDDVVLEVGCGTGSLTSALAQRAGAVVVAEYDPHLAAIARSQLQDLPQVQIINVDILATKHRLHAQVLEALSQILPRHSGRFLLVANLPYHVSCPVMLNLVQNAPQVDAMAVTVQKEVADRMVAEPGSGHYGILSILLAVTGHTQWIRTLKPSVFWPPPQVASAMVLYRRDPSRVARIRDMACLVATVKRFMQHRRKMLKAAVKTGATRLSDRDWNAAFEAAGVDPRWRPEQVTPEQFVSLANALPPADPAH